MTQTTKNKIAQDSISLSTKDWKDLAVEMATTTNLSWRKIAKSLQVSKSTVSDYLRKQIKVEPSESDSIKGKWENALDVKKYKGAKVFLGDVETSLTVSYHFGRFKQFITPRQVIQEPFMLTFAGKWLHSPAIYSRKLPDYPELFAEKITNDRGLIEDLWSILDECDIFIAHNAKFDRGWANQRFAYYGMNPPSPYQVIDTLGALKESFSLPSNALEASCNYFELHRKLHHEGIGLWIKCMEGNVEAYEEMETYNIGDIPTLEDLYLVVRPFMKKHPNVALYKDGQAGLACVRCGSEEMKEEIGKYATTYLSKFKVYRCECCGSVMRDRNNIRTKVDMKNTLLNVM